MSTTQANNKHIIKTYDANCFQVHARANIDSLSPETGSQNNTHTSASLRAWSSKGEGSVYHYTQGH